MAKASCQNTSDGEGRRPGEQIGLDLFEEQKEGARKTVVFAVKKLRRLHFLGDSLLRALKTRVVLAVNDADLALHAPRVRAVP